MHLTGFINVEIKRQLNIMEVYIIMRFRCNNNIKNIWRVSKDSMARVFRSIYEKEIKEINNLLAKLYQPNEYFKIFLIIFSTPKLLGYYSNSKINILALKCKILIKVELTVQYDKVKKSCESTVNTLERREKFQIVLNNLIKDIKDYLLIAL